MNRDFIPLDPKDAKIVGSYSADFDFADALPKRRIQTAETLGPLGVPEVTRRPARRYENPSVQNIFSARPDSHDA